MLLSETIRQKIFLMEEVINFPTSLLSHKNYHWENLPMVPYSDLTGAVSSLAQKGRKVVIVTGFYVPVGDPPATETDGPPGALALAKGLRDLGMEVSLLSDEYSLSAIEGRLKDPWPPGKRGSCSLLSTGAFRPGSHEPDDE